MAWIRTLSDDEARGALADLFEANRDPRSGELDEILRVHSLVPESLAAHLAVYRSAMRPTRGLGGRQREMIALVVSVLNGCRY